MKKLSDIVSMKKDDYTEEIEFINKYMANPKVYVYNRKRNTHGYLNLYEDLQALEIKQERMCDPRRSLRLEREFVTLLGDQVIKEELSPYFNTLKKELLKKVIMDFRLSIVKNNFGS